MNLELQSLLTLLIGLFFGIFITIVAYRITIGNFKKISLQIVQKAEADAENIKTNAHVLIKQKEIEAQKEIEKNSIQAHLKLQIEEERIKAKEDKLETRMNLVEKKLSDIDKKEAVIALRKDRIDEEKNSLRKLEVTLKEELENVSKLSVDEAKELLLKRLENQITFESASLTKRIILELEEDADQKAARILTSAINRMASSVVSDATVTTVSLPNDEMKGRIIGKEGRNIRTLELATGVNILIDDTPGAVVLSGFDPVRKHIAKLSLSELVLDGRIHPTRIEEVVEKNKNLVTKQIKSYGEDAALRAGIMGLHPELITLLGKLKFRYSYGQNVLDHSLEVSHLMGLMAAELNLDIMLSKRIGLLHDIGKAVTHEIEGSHAIIGYNFALKYGESQDVASGIGSHHEEMLPTTLEASLCSAADTLSAARPGARIESVEHYLKRLNKLEEIANLIPGVEKAYAMQAGKEVRVLVHPDTIDDDGLTLLARCVAKKIETTLAYPGKIKVTVIREKRAVEYAL
jgi:ribonuclease Y